MTLDYSASLWMMSDVGLWQHFSCSVGGRVVLILKERGTSMTVNRDVLMLYSRCERPRLEPDDLMSIT